MFLPLLDEVAHFLKGVRVATDELRLWDSTARNVILQHRGPKDFTPDGRMVGDIGEVLAERYFAIRLKKSQKAGHDAVLESDESIRVEIKITRSNVFQFRKIPDRVIAMELDEKQCRIEVVYNGAGEPLRQRIKALRIAEWKDDHWSLPHAVNVKPDDLRAIAAHQRGLSVPLRSTSRFMER